LLTDAQLSKTKVFFIYKKKLGQKKKKVRHTKSNAEKQLLYYE